MGDERGIVADDVNLNVPDEEEFLLRFLRARKFDSQKAFTMVSRKRKDFGSIKVFSVAEILPHETEMSGIIYVPSSFRT